MVAEIFDFMSTVQTAFCMVKLIYARQLVKLSCRKIR